MFFCAVAVSSALAGCGGKEPTVAETGVTASQYASHQYGYSFQYPARCTLIKPTPGAADPGLLEQVMVADPKGLVVAGAGLDVFTVSVYGLSPPADPGDVKKHRNEFRSMVLELVGQPTGLRVVAAPTVSALGGQPALETEYFSRVGAQRVGTLAYLVPKGDHLYWVRLQSSSKTQGASTLVVALATFNFK